MDLNRYLESFESGARKGSLAGEPDWLRGFRRQGQERFRANGLPTFRDEGWKYTSLSKLGKIAFEPATGILSEKVLHEVSARLKDLSFSEGAHALVFVDGQFSVALSSVSCGGKVAGQPLPAGVKAGSLALALRENAPGLSETFKSGPASDDGMKALNESFFTDGPYIETKPGAAIAPLFHIVYVTSPAGSATAAHSRGLVRVAAGSQLRIVESFISAPGGNGTTLGSFHTRFELATDALVDHVKLQNEGPDAYHFGDVRVQQAAKSSFRSTLVSLGAAIGRSETHVALEGTGAECSLNGLYAARGAQHVDCLTLIDHAVPGCASHEIYKGVLDGEARGVFNGKVLVRKDAQKTTAEQSNQNLLLSETAIANTRPQLQIYADDVKCTHGATVGRLSDEAMFYLRSRGIGPAEARVLLTQAFAAEVVDRIQMPAVRESVKRGFQKWLA